MRLFFWGRSIVPFPGERGEEKVGKSFTLFRERGVNECDHFDQHARAWSRERDEHVFVHGRARFSFLEI